MPAECPFSVGQRVTEHCRGPGGDALHISFEPPEAPDPLPGLSWIPVAIHTVSDVSRYPGSISVEGGRTFDRFEWRAFIRPTRPGDAEAIARKRTLDTVCRVDRAAWEKLSPEALAEVVERLKSAGAWEVSDGR